MANVKIIEVCKVAPPPASMATTSSSSPNSLPLTCLDLIWLRFQPIQRIFFYELPNLEDPNRDTTLFFHSDIVPRLKHSLSLTLKHFLPLSGNLIWPESSYKPLILYNEGNEDAVSFTVAKTDADFHRLSSTNEFLEATEYHHLIPNLAVSRERAAILAFQVTLFPKFGFSIAMVNHHAAIDGKSVHMFLKTWTHICQSQQQQQEYNYSYSPLELKPFFDRTVIVDSKGIDAIIAKQLRELDGGPHNRSLIPWEMEVQAGIVRGTFQLTRENINKLRQLLNVHNSSFLHLSTFCLTFSYILVSLVKAKGLHKDGQKVIFGFAVDARSRFEPPLPETYLGNCVVGKFADAYAKDLAGEDGLFVASDLVSIDKTGAISLSDTRNGDGIEVGLVLKKHDMENFAFLFHQVPSPASMATTSSSSPNSLPLTCLDLIWLRFQPIQRIFFYELPNLEDPNRDTTLFFHSDIVPRLKHSLSLTLKHFLPLSGNLIWPESSNKPLIFYNEGNEDAVSFIVAETDADFHRLSGTNEFLEATEYHHLIPNLAVSRERAAILAFQLTLFPNFGFSIGMANHHAGIDGKSVHMFLKTWTHICQSQQQEEEYNYSYSPLELKPFFDRTVIVDSKGIDAIIAKQLRELDGGPHNRSLIPWEMEVQAGIVRGTFQLTRENINKLRQLLKAYDNLLHLSTFCLTFSYILVCLVKAKVLHKDGQKIIFGFAVDARSRFEPPLPETYLGNCVVGKFADAYAKDLAGEDGLFVAVKAISNAIRSLETGKETILHGLENLVPIFLKSLEGKRSHDGSYSIAGSPKFEPYNTDFGWGRPKKSDVVSIDKTGAISLSDTRNGDGIEVGLMAKVKIIEVCKVVPSPASMATTSSSSPNSLPLTCLDLIWLRMQPIQRIFFYEFPNLEDPNRDTTLFFHSDIVPRLKHSLSLTLKHFLPLSGNLIWPESSYKPLILYNEDDEDAVSVTVAETDADFHRLSGTNEFFEATEYHPFIPNLAVSRERAAILAFQVTLFPNFGFSIGMANHHAAIDGKSVHMFLKTWTHICQSQQQQQEYNYSYSPLELKPFFDRTVIVDSKGIDAIIAEQLRELDGGPHNRSLIPWKKEVPSGTVRGTFQVTRENINKLRQLLNVHNNSLLHLSSFCLTFSYILVSLAKAKGLHKDGQKIFFGFAVDARSRFEPPLPGTYLGNCVVGKFAEAYAKDLAGEDGLFLAVKAISDAIRSYETAKETILYGLENLVPVFLKSHEEGKGSHDELYTIASSPKFEPYNTDFGWGRPKKSDVVSIDKTGAISLSDTRNGDGIEVGLVLKKHDMESFAFLFQQGLE
ncbi:hypothetical protein G4B88_027388 [Cannabis sativa]|uniref:Uncharacterized protein n=1 Tax=Cannabis sativa TaxID=3483 RepID=A0A7J6HSH1_CANSA|nr:hypothetical protein G4B88_027388 [Cannabis sativa]